MGSNNVPDWAHEKLERRASTAVLFLQQLTAIQQIGDGLKIPTMPKSAVVTAEGIAIVSMSKYGALFTVTHHRGFVIRKLVSGGEIRWSPPVFLTGSAMGAGLSGGYKKSRTCIALANDQAVQSALRGKSDFGPCVHFLLDMNGSRIKKAQFDSSEHDNMTAVKQDRDGGMTAKYFQVDAAMVDISLEGGSTAVDTNLNAAVYGRGVSTEDILQGKVPHPSEFQLLYTVLQQFVDETAPVVPKRDVGAAPGARSIRSVRSITMRPSPEEPSLLVGVGCRAVPSIYSVGLRVAPIFTKHVPRSLALRCMAAKAKPRQKEDNVYSKTVNLPITSFDMRANSVVREPQLQAFWEEQRVYEVLSRGNPGEVYTLHDGPPYANGELHMGHALNKGRKAIYVPGWDTHGLPIELKALQSLSAEERDGLSPLALRQRCRRFALKTIDSQRTQFKRFGVWGDWSAPYVTLDPKYEAAQLRVFGKMFLSGHIYRGQKPVHWSPSTRTALAEAELEYPEGHTSPSVYVGLCLRGLGPAVPGDVAEHLLGAELAVWTTTPWTLPANRAVAVHPELEYSVVRDSDGRRLVAAAALVPSLRELLGGSSWDTLCTVRGEALVGCHYASPLPAGPGDEGGPRPVLSAPDLVTAEAGTGLVHMAPGHGHEDFALGVAAGIRPVSPVDDAGHFTAEAGPGLEGLPVLGAGGAAVVAALQASGRLLAQRAHVHKYPYDWRSKQPVIVRTTRQWFASVEGLGAAALAAVDGVQFVPGAGRNRIASMITGRSDWCISRQRVWGVPIPAFFYADSEEPLMNASTLEHVARVVEERGSDAWWELPIEDLLPPEHRAGRLEAERLVKGSDTMDVWFDSGTSWASVLVPGGADASGAPAPRFPADLYLEGSDQHRGWFQSSLLTAVAAAGVAPYRAVLTHGFLLDEAGVKQSKSIGNTLDPRTVMLGGKDAKKEPAYGADVLRLWVASVDYTADVTVGPRIMAQVSDVYRKVRLTLRYMLGNLAGFDPESSAVPLAFLGLTDRYLLWRLAALADECTAAYDTHQFFRVYQALQRFCVVDLSNFYLDASKDRLYVLGAGSGPRAAAQTVLAAALRTLLPLVAPLAPHLAEDAWQGLPWAAPTPSVFGAGWAAPAQDWRAFSEEDQALMRSLLAVRAEVNALQERARAAKLIGSSLEAQITVHVSDPELRAALRTLQKHDNGQDTLQNTCIVSQAALVDEAPGQEEGAMTSAGPVPLVPGEPARGTLVVQLRRASGTKCARCWNYSEAVGVDAEHPQLCQRCVPVVKALPGFEAVLPAQAGARAGV